MRKLLHALGMTMSLALAAGALADGLKHEVRWSDLAPLQDDELSVLKEPRHATTLAAIRLAGARLAEDNAEKALDAARKTRKAIEAGKSAAKAEQKSAEAENDAARRDRAKAELARDEARLVVAEARLDHAELDLKARKAAREAAEANDKVAQSRFELACVQLIAAERLQASESYAVKDFREQMEKLEGETEKAAKKSAEAEDKSATALERWRRLEAEQPRDSTNY